MEKLVTGNEIFDHVAAIAFGNSILVLDITRFESMLFLNALLKKSGHQENTLVISCEPVDTPFKVKKVDLAAFHDPTEFSIEISRFRQSLTGHGLVIHHYLPHILVKEGEELVLRMIEYWLMKQHDENVSHLFTLPKATFPFFEKKLQSLVSGVISIDILGGQAARSLSFQILRSCRPEFHMESFPFVIENENLLIKWGDVFTDSLPREEEGMISDKIQYIRENLLALRIVRADSHMSDEKLNTYDRWLLAQLVNWDLTTVERYFPERMDEIVRKLALWNLRGLITFEKAVTSQPQSLRLRLSIGLRIALAFPTTLALYFLRRRRHTIPMKVYHALRRSVQAYLSDRSDANSMAKELTQLETYFQDMTARAAAIETYYELGQDPKFRFDLKYLPKLVSVALYYGYGVKTRISNPSEGLYLIEVRDCFVCSGLKSENPICQLLIGTIVGCCSVCFKESFSCNEVQCKSMGDRSCVFHLRRISEQLLSNR